MRFIAILTVSMLLMSCENNAQNVKELKTHKDSVSYAIGYSIGQNFKMQSVDVDPVILAAAINHVTKDDKSALMTEEVAQQVMMAYQTELMAKQEEERKAKGAKNKTEGEKFLAANKSKEGVITTVPPNSSGATAEKLAPATSISTLDGMVRVRYLTR